MSKTELLLEFVRARGSVHPREVDEHFSHGTVKNYWGGSSNATTHLLEALHEQGARELTIVANNSGNGDHGLARLINSGRVRKVICSFPVPGSTSGEMTAFERLYDAGRSTWSSCPRAPSSSASVPPAPASARSSRQLAPGRSSPMARRRA